MLDDGLVSEISKLTGAFSIVNSVTIAQLSLKLI